MKWADLHSERRLADSRFKMLLDELSKIVMRPGGTQPSRVQTRARRLFRGSQLLLTLSLAGALCGCAHPYVMKLSNGTQIQSANRPKLKGATYYFKDANGHVNTMPQGRVTEIEPASMAAKDTSFKPHYPKPKTHWWQFWR